MKFLRLFIVALLAVLLPLRGALAAVAVCEDVDAGERTELVVHSHGAHDGAAQAGQDEVSHDHGDGVVHSHNGVTHVVKCATSCSLTPLAMSDPSLVGSVVVTTISFPAYRALAPSFISDGQERPPRTL